MGFARALYGQGYMRMGESKGMGRGLKVGFGGLKWVVGVSEEVKVLNTIVENQTVIEKLMDGSNDGPTDRQLVRQINRHRQTDRPIALYA